MSDSRDRHEIVDDLVHLRRSPEELLSELGHFAWDSEEELVVMTAADAVEVLARGLEGTVSLAQLANWADALEMREDVGLDSEAEEPLRAMIYELANPFLEGPLTVQRVREWVARLSTLV